MSVRATTVGLVLSLAWPGSSRAEQPAPRRRAERAPRIASEAHVRNLLADRMQHNGVGVVVGVIGPSGRRLITYGKTGASDARPLDGDTLFQIGSVTKVFTGLLLADMVVRREVDLNGPAARYLPPGAKMPERGRPITLRDLATHVSGLPSMPTNFSLQGEPDPYEAYSVEQLHRFLARFELEREPGVVYRYSNLGVALLGRLLARRAGMEYEALLKERLLAPLGMRSTSIALTPAMARRLAPGHDRYLRPVRTWEMRTLPASGSLRSTGNDLLKFLAAYLGYEATPLRSAMDLQLSVRQARPRGWQALGWGIGSDGIVSHPGGKQGYRSAVAFDPKSRTGVIVLANARTDDEPIDLALHLLTGEPLARPRPAPKKEIIVLDRSLLATYAGRYRLGPDTIVTVARMDDHLIVDAPYGISEFFPEGTADFFLNTGNDEMTFQVDADGRVTGLVLYEDGKEGGEGKLAPRIDGGD